MAFSDQGCVVQVLNNPNTNLVLVKRFTDWMTGKSMFLQRVAPLSQSLAEGQNRPNRKTLPTIGI
ncbi:MAG: hypothetical protein ACI9G1_006121 [Pirellulaceae bacterium]